MKISKLHLTNYKPFDSIDASMVTIDNIQKIQVLIGDNNSGKSSILFAYNPLQINSNMFYPNGKKSLEFTHENEHYILEYLSGKKEKDTGKYNFIKNGKELNDGHTLTAQLNLIYKHLEYDEFINDLFYNKHKITDMKPADRAEFFMKANPVDLEFIKRKYMILLKTRNNYKNQITGFRNTEIEKRKLLMNDKEYEENKNLLSFLEKCLVNTNNEIIKLELEIDHINKKIYSGDEGTEIYIEAQKLDFYNIDFIKIIYEIDNSNISYTDKISKLTATLFDGFWNLFLDESNVYIEEYSNNFHIDVNKQFENIEYENFYKCYNYFQTVSNPKFKLLNIPELIISEEKDIIHKESIIKNIINVQNNQIQKLQNSINEISKKHDEIVKKIELNNSNTIQQYQLELDNVNLTLQKYEHINENNFHPIQDLNNAVLCINQIESLMKELSVHQVENILFKDDYLNLRNEYNTIDVDHRTTLQNINTYFQKIECKEEELKECTRIKPSKKCNIDNCEIKLNFENTFNRLDKDKNLLQKEYDKYKKDQIKLMDRKTKLSEMLTIQKNMMGYVKEIIRLIKDNNWMFNLFQNSSETIISLLNTDPKQIINILENYHSLSVSYYEKIKLLKNKKELEDKLKLNDLEKYFSNEQLQQLLMDTELELNKHLTELDKLNDELKFFKQFELIYNTCYNIKKIIIAYQLNLDFLEELLIEKKDLMYCLYKYWCLKWFNSAITIDIGLLRSSIDEQKTIRALLESNNKELEKRVNFVNKLDLILKAIDHKSGIPYKFVRWYLGELLKKINAIINEVWESPLEILLEEDNGKLEYKFRVKIRNGTNEDISSCSDGQKAIINLAFNLSIILQKKIHDKYPLFLDEIGREFDEKHKEKILTLLLSMLDKKFIHQLFLINHDAALSKGFDVSDECDVICLRSENIIVPEKYNTNVTIL